MIQETNRQKPSDYVMLEVSTTHDENGNAVYDMYELLRAYESKQKSEKMKKWHRERLNSNK